MVKILYELPEDRDHVAELAKAIPSNWCWVDGHLIAPRELYDGGQIAENTRLFLSRFYSIKPTIVGANDVPFEYENWERDKGKTMPPKINDILLRGKLFSSVVFNDAGYETASDGLTIDVVRELAEKFIREGYKGRISAFSGYRNNEKYSNPERFSFTHYDTTGSLMWPLPPHVRLEWNEGHGGKRERLEQIMKVIQRIGLRELQLQEA